MQIDFQKLQEVKCKDLKLRVVLVHNNVSVGSRGGTALKGFVYGDAENSISKRSSLLVYIIFPGRAENVRSLVFYWW